MKKVYLFLAEGFEEVEAIAPIDLLRRAGANVATVSITNDLSVTGAHQIPVKADMSIFDSKFCDGDMIVLPGGYPGYQNLANCKELFKIIDYYFESKKLIAAICASPAEVLGKNGYLKDYDAVCYKGMEAGLNCKNNPDTKVCVSDNIITSKSAGTAVDFALGLINALFGQQKMLEIKESIIY